MFFSEGKLDSKSTVVKNVTVQFEVQREIEYFNLDVIISVGYRVKSQRGVVFRKWAASVLKDYMFKCYAINQKRLKYKVE